MRTAILASLVMICINFSSFAQSAPLNKQQTVDYIKKLFKANYDSPERTLTDFYLDGKVLVVKTKAGDTYNQYRSDLTIQNVEQLKIDKYSYAGSDEQFYSVEGNKDTYIFRILLESDALRLKKALAHLITLVQNEKSTDPFDN